MNPDLVADERQKDQQKLDDGEPPENVNVIQGPMRRQLEHGTLIRNGQRYDVSPPDDPTAFRWHPTDLHLPIGELKLRYDPPVWAAFKVWATKTTIQPGTTVWNWLMSKPIA